MSKNKYIEFIKKQRALEYQGINHDAFDSVEINEKNYDDLAPISKDIHKIAHKAYNNKDYKTAITHYTAAIQNDPSDRHAHLARAMSHYALGNEKEGHDDIAKATELYKKYKSLKEDYIDESNKDTTTPYEIHKIMGKQLHPALSLSKLPKKIQDMHAKAKDAHEEGRYDDALNHYNEIIKHNPSDHFAHQGIGFIHMRRKNHKEGRKYLDRSLDIGIQLKKMHGKPSKYHS